LSPMLVDLWIALRPNRFEPAMPMSLGMEVILRRRAPSVNCKDPKH
jgi:hypothetical protein